MPKPRKPGCQRQDLAQIVSDTKPGRDSITGNATIHGGDFDDHHANRPVEQQAAAHGSGQGTALVALAWACPVLAQEAAPAAPETPAPAAAPAQHRRNRRHRFAHHLQRLQRAHPHAGAQRRRDRQSAQPNIFTTIAQLPSLQGSTGATYGTNSTSSGTQGLSSFSLRGLGPIRTLTLLDGQRVVGANVTGVPDISLFPQLLVDRVDVVTGGASASYGSDAVGGVVNFVTNTH
jgi:outer membrane receptor protein involved in Fe transport